MREITSYKAKQGIWKNINKIDQSSRLNTQTIGFLDRSYKILVFRDKKEM